MAGTDGGGELGRHRGSSDEEDRDGPLFIALGSKLVLMVVVLWRATPPPLH